MSAHRDVLLTIQTTIAVFLLPMLAQGQTVIHVDTTAAGANNGTTWEHAYLDLQDALTDAAGLKPPVQIWVAAATYRPDSACMPDPCSGTDGDRGATFQLISGVSLYGGFPTGGGDGTFDARDPVAFPTILSGDLADNDDDGFLFIADNSRHVVRASPQNTTADVFSGLIVEGGNADFSGGEGIDGGGMYCAGGAPTISQCVFRRNTGMNGGAGLSILNATITIIDTEISRNRSHEDGQFHRGIGVRLVSDGSTPVDVTLINCLIRDNRTSPDADTNSESNGAGLLAGTLRTLIIRDSVIEDNALLLPGRGGGIYVTDVISFELDGCIVRDNTARALPGTGAGIYVTNAASLTCSDCLFEDNYTESGGGGGLVIDGSTTAQVERCTFRENIAIEGWGGAIYGSVNGSVIVEDCLFDGNSNTPDNVHSTSGGAIHFESDLVVRNCRFVNNTSSGQTGGGAIAHTAGHLEVANCLFYANSATHGFTANGGAIHASGEDGVDIINCTIANNSTTEFGGGIYFNNTGGALSVFNTILWNSTANGTLEEQQIYVDAGSALVAYSCVEGLNEYVGNGNTGFDPRFLDAPTGDLHLTGVSPCVDAGDNDALPPDTYDCDGDGDAAEVLPCDLDGGARRIDDPDVEPDPGNPGTVGPPVVDMGAYEYQPADCNDNGIPDACDLACGDPSGPCDLPGCGQSEDCDGNEIPDECEWLDCNANGVLDACDVDPTDPDGDGTVLPDCNGNLTPDECDVDPSDPDGDGQVSDDCQPDGIPDECQEAGHVVTQWAGGSAGVWDEALNWCPDVVPDNDNDAAFDVAIDDDGDPQDETVVTLDRSPTIDGLTIGVDAVVEVNASSGAPVRSLAVVLPDGPPEPGEPVHVFENAGTIRATDGVRLVLDAPRIDQSSTGILEAIGGPDEASKIQINGALVVGGTARTEGPLAAIELLGSAELQDVIVEGNVGRGGGDLVQTVLVPHGQIGVIAGGITNDGVIVVGESGHDTQTYLLSAVDGATLSTTTGQGRVDMMNRFARLGDSKGFIINGANHTIQGAGRILGLFVNEYDSDLLIPALVIANHPSDPLVLDWGFKTNAGLMQAVAGGVLQIEDIMDQTATGLIEAIDGGIVAINGDIAGTGAYRAYCTLAGRGGCTPPPKLEVADGAAARGATMDVLDNGVVEVDGGGEVNLTGDLTINLGGIFQGTVGSAGVLVAQNVWVLGDDGENVDGGGQLLLDGTMSVIVTEDMGIGCNTGGRGGCTPPPRLPSLGVSDAANVAVGGILTFADSVDVQIGQSVTFSLGGDFDNRCTTPTTFHWELGPLIMNGSAPQVFEVAGFDFGEDPAGFVDNFAMGTLELAADAVVNIVDVFDNQQDGLGECDEVLYVDTLILNFGSVLNTDGCTVYPGLFTELVFLSIPGPFRCVEQG